MSEPSRPTDPRGPEIPPGERVAIERLAQRLEAERPVPSAAFRGELRRRLMSGRPARAPLAPRRLRVLVTAYASSGIALLVVAAVGLAGLGPFGAG